MQKDWEMSCSCLPRKERKNGSVNPSPCLCLTTLLPKPNRESHHGGFLTKFVHQLMYKRVGLVYSKQYIPVHTWHMKIEYMKVVEFLYINLSDLHLLLSCCKRVSEIFRWQCPAQNYQWPVISESGNHTGILGFTWELFRNTNSWVSPQTPWIRNSRGGADNLCFNKSFQVILIQWGLRTTTTDIGFILFFKGRRLFFSKKIDSSTVSFSKLF